MEVQNICGDLSNCVIFFLAEDLNKAMDAPSLL